MYKLASHSHPIRAWGIQTSVWILFSFLGIATATAQVALTDGIIRTGDSVWEVSTRHLASGYPQDCDVSYQVHQFANCAWNVSDKETFLQEAVQVPLHTVIYVHGNWMPLCEARQRALRIYQALSQRADIPIRLIAFSWPSEQKERAARDVISKKPLIAANSFHLANLINQLPAGQPCGLIGYSFGAAIACGSLHLLSGGALEHQLLSASALPSHLMRVSLIAPAFDRTDLSPNGHYSEALNSTVHMLNLYNSQDPILRRFRFFDRSTDPVAAGFSGLAVSRAVSPLAANEKVEQYDCSAVGRSHAEAEYLHCSAFYHVLENVLCRE